MADAANKNEPMKAGEAEAKFDEKILKPETPRWVTIAAIASLLGALLIYILRLDRVVGLFVDDGWYVLLAKSLATGQGYSLINSPSPGILPLYPPAFPFLLSLFYRISPDFPDNVWLLKSVSVAAMMGVGVIAYRYFIERKLPAHLALAISVASVLSPPLVFLATSTVMSECVFALNFLGAIFVMEKCVRAGKSAKGVQLAIAGAALASIGFLTRSIAIALVAAGFLYLLKARLIKSAIVFAITVAAFAGPWVIYTRLHAPTPEQRREQGGHIVLPYTIQFWQKRAGFTFSGTVTAADLPGRVVSNAIEITGRDVGRIVVTPLFEALRDPFAEAQRQEVQEGGRGDTWSVSFFLSVVAVIGLVAAIREKLTMAELAVPLSLAVTALWPWETFRFVLPLVPFLIFYFLMGANWLLGRRPSLRRREGLSSRIAILTVVALAIIAVNLYGNINYILKYSDDTALDRPQWLQVFDGAEEVLKWADAQTQKEAVIATDNPPLVHLYTGRKTIGADDMESNRANWERLKVRYIVWLPVYPKPIDPAERKYNLVYHARGNPLFRVLDLGEPGAAPVGEK